jgi:tRNA pseudouridine38-40 synthase
MPRFRLVVEYAGARYSGWQIQENARTVHGEIARAIRQVTGRDRFELYGSGRTDAGVHALRQVAHLDIATSLSPSELCARINGELPSDVAVREVVVASHRFHARHDAVARSYLYQVARRRIAFGKPYVWWVRETLDVGRMREAASLLTGFHDFRSFTDDRPDQKSTKVLVERLEIGEVDDFVLIRVEGSHFLWKMVRRMVGVLVEVGRGALSPDAVARLLEEPSSLPSRVTAPASGLFLERVYYPGDPRDHPLRPILAL